MPSYLFQKYLPNVLTEEECLRLISLAGEGEQATVGNRSTNLSLRRSRVTWLKRSEPEVQKVLNAMHRFARDQKIDIVNGKPEIQLTRYDAKDKGVYGPHMDCGESGYPLREVSITLLLSDPAEFSGGELLFPHLGRDVRSLRRGDAHVFRSWMVHAVNPVWRGTRWSLVIWIRRRPDRPEKK